MCIRDRATAADMSAMPAEAMGGMTADMMAAMPAEAMGGIDADMMAAMPPMAMQGMDADMMSNMPAEAMQGMDADMTFSNNYETRYPRVLTFWIGIPNYFGFGYPRHIQFRRIFNQEVMYPRFIPH